MDRMKRPCERTAKKCLSGVIVRVDRSNLLTPLGSDPQECGAPAPPCESLGSDDSVTRACHVIASGDIKLLAASFATGDVECFSNRMNINDSVKRRGQGEKVWRAAGLRDTSSIRSRKGAALFPIACTLPRFSLFSSFFHRAGIFSPSRPDKNPARRGEKGNETRTVIIRRRRKKKDKEREGRKRGRE